MKVSVVVFFVALLIGSVKSFAQTGRTFYSLEEAAMVPVDSVLKLDLSKKKYHEIPAELYRYTSLKELDLSQNKLVRLPDEFYFEHLEVLNLEKNDLDTFSLSLCGLTSLRQLYLGRNKIKSLPECIGSLQELVILDAWFNLIRDLPMALTTMKKLRFMDLRGITYSKNFQKKWNELLPWVKIEFDLGCDCGD